MSPVRSIETIYRGYRFRSRLEARWAVFMDAIGVHWEYEPEGFTLSDGTRYLPDFRISAKTGDVWAEVKPTGGDFDKASRFAFDSGVRIFGLEGTPDARSGWVFAQLIEADNPEGIEVSSSGVHVPKSVDRATYMPDLMRAGVVFERCSLRIAEAIRASRSARFEFGERGS